MLAARVCQLPPDDSHLPGQENAAVILPGTAPG
jgi:hypothetical protein